MSTARAGTAWYVTGLLLLTAATGAVDAVSYLALDRVFTGNMTGNVLFIGFAAAGVGAVPLLNNAVALGGFALGSAAGGRIVGRGHPAGLTRAGAWVLGASAVVALGLATTWWVLGDLAAWHLLAVTAVLAALMGAQVAAVKPVGNADITTVVVTNTLANLTRDSRLGGGRQGWRVASDRFLAIIAMGLGALLGAAVVRGAGGPASLAVASAVLALAWTALMIGRARQAKHERAGAGQG